MAAFPELKRSLFAWVKHAIEQLSQQDNARDYATDLGHWQRDSDGVFRDSELAIEVWHRIAVNRIFDLPSWAAVLDVLHGDSRLARQVDTLVGTVQGARRVEATSIGRRVLPRPNELGQVVEAFEGRYEELESSLAVDEIEDTVIWPLPGRRSETLPVQLDTNLELDAMSDRELGFALDMGIVQTTFPRQRLLNPQLEHRTCARYRYSLPKLVGDTDVNETLRAGQEIESRLEEIESALKESLAIVLPDAVGIAGRFGIVSQPGSPLSGGVAFQQATLAQGLRLRRAHMSQEQAAELIEVWRLLRQPGLLE